MISDGERRGEIRVKEVWVGENVKTSFTFFHPLKVKEVLG